jgi:predicted ATPase
MVFPVVNRLLPGLRPFGVVTEKPEELRFRLLDAVASLLVRISNETPLLIALDDLHWADEGTLGLLVAVARERLYERHALEGLSEAEVREYCAAALPPGGSAEVPRAVHAVTEGNPLFVVEVVRDLVHQGVGSLDGGLPHLPEGRGK